MTQKPVKPTTSTDRPASSRRPRTRRRKPSHGEIAERAYFIHLEDGEPDQLANWLRAERELATLDDPHAADLGPGSGRRGAGS
jgi:hypothetical protein